MILDKRLIIFDETIKLGLKKLSIDNNRLNDVRLKFDAFFKKMLFEIAGALQPNITSLQSRNGEVPHKNMIISGSSFYRYYHNTKDTLQDNDFDIDFFVWGDDWKEVYSVLEEQMLTRIGNPDLDIKELKSKQYFVVTDPITGNKISHRAITFNAGAGPTMTQSKVKTEPSYQLIYAPNATSPEDIVSSFDFYHSMVYYDVFRRTFNMNEDIIACIIKKILMPSGLGKSKFEALEARYKKFSNIFDWADENSIKQIIEKQQNEGILS